MHRSGRAGSLLFIGIVPVLCLLAVLLAAGSAWAFFELEIDGRAVTGPSALIPLDSGLGIALPLLESELGFSVDRSGHPAVELRIGDRRALVVADDADALVDGRAAKLSAAPRRQGEELYVPLTLVADLARLRIELNLAAGVVALNRRDSGTVRVGSAPGPAVSREDQDLVREESAEKPRDEAPPAPPGLVLEQPAPEESSLEEPALEEPSRKEEPRRDDSPPDEPALAIAGGEHLGAGGLRPIGAGVDFEPDEGRHRTGGDSEAEFAAVLPLPADSPTVVRDIRLVERDGHVHIELTADGPLRPRVMFLDNPARLVLDMENAVGATGWRASPGDGRIVEQLRVSGGEAGGLRVVADLTGPAGYTAIGGDDGLYALRLNHQLQILHAGAEGDDVALHLRATGPVPYRIFRLGEPERLVIDLFGVSIPEAAEVPRPAPWASALRFSQFEQTAVRGVFTLVDGVAAVAEPREGVLLPGVDGRVRVLVNADGFAAINPARPEAPGNGLQFVGFGRDGDLEYILIQAEGPMDISVSRLRGPDRIVLDLPGVGVARTLGLAPEESRVLRAVRAGQAEEDTARIVAETVGVAEHYLLLSPDRTRAVLGLRPSELAGRTVVVDAGHGGKDPGAIGHSGSYEKDVTLSIALQVADFLGRAGANVVLTRDRDMELALAERAQLANLIRADAFVSIHADAVGFGRIATGTSTFYHPENGNSRETSLNRQYALTLQQELLQAVGLPDRGVHERAFHVVLNTKMPSALVEVGFIDNPDEEQLLLDPEFQARAARGVADGIIRFFSEQTASRPEETKEWRTRAAEATGLWVLLGTVPPQVTALEPTPAFTFARLEGRGAPEPELDMTATPRFPEL